MRISHFFIDRPIFAAVVSIVFVILGGVVVRAPAGRAISRDRAADHQRHRPVSRRQRRGVADDRGRRRSSSRSTASRTCSTCPRTRPPTAASPSRSRFDLGTNLDIAQVQVQNRVAIAQPRLPADVRNIGVTVQQGLARPDDGRCTSIRPTSRAITLFISNYATLEVDGSADPRRRRRLDHRVRRPRLFDAHLARSRPPAVARPDRDDVTSALQGQNVQVASGVLDQPPVAQPGRLPDRGADARPARRSRRVRQHRRQADAERRWCGSRTSAGSSWPRSGLHRRTPISTTTRRCALAHFPAARLQRARHRRAASTRRWRSCRRRFPPGLKYDIVYNPTQFIQQSVDAVIETIFEAIVLVVLVVIVFLQTWRAAIIPHRRHPGVAGRHVLRAWRRSASRSTTCRCSAWCWRSASWSTTPSWWWRTSSATSRAGHAPREAAHKTHGRGRRRADRHRAGAVRGVRARRRSSPASPASSTASSR